MATATSPTKSRPALKNVIVFITFEGLYYTAGEKGKNVYSYVAKDVPFNLEQLNDPKESALSLWRHNYAQHIMPKLYPDFMGLATFEIKDKSCPTDPTLLLQNIGIMNFAELTEYIDSNNLDIITELYEDAGSLRSAIRSYGTDREGFLKTQRITEKRRGPQLHKQKAATEMLELHYKTASASTARNTNTNKKPKPETDDDLEF